MKIDFQTHYCPPEYFKTLVSRPGFPSVEESADGKLFMKYGPNAGYPVTRLIVDPEQQLKEMDRAGIDTNVVTMNIPGVERVEPELGLKQARVVNDSYAKLMS